MTIKLFLLDVLCFALLVLLMWGVITLSYNRGYHAAFDVAPPACATPVVMPEVRPDSIDAPRTIRF